MFAWVIFVFSFSSAISRLSIIWSLSPFFNIYIYPSIHCCISGLTPLRCDWSSQSSAKHRKCVLPAFLVLFVFAPFCSFGFIGLLLFVYLCVLVRCFFCILYVELCLEFWLQIFVALSPVFGLSFFSWSFARLHVNWQTTGLSLTPREALCNKYSLKWKWLVVRSEVNTTTSHGDWSE